ncbi:hypothetical protein AAMO2058_001019600 [Amorphochlora amoebiformis]
MVRPTPLIAISTACALSLAVFCLSLSSRASTLSSPATKVASSRYTFARTPQIAVRHVSSCPSRRVIARNEGMEQIPEPQRPDDVTGYTARDSAGQSNIFGRETKSYVGESVSRSGLVTGGGILAAAAAVGAIVVPNLNKQEDFSASRYGELVEYSKKFADELGVGKPDLPQAAPPADASAESTTPL